MGEYQSKIDVLNSELTGAGAAGVKKIQEMGVLQNLLEECEAKWLAASEERETVLRETSELQGS